MWQRHFISCRKDKYAVLKKPDYAFKAECLKSGKVEISKKVDAALYFARSNTPPPSFPLSFDYDAALQILYDETSTPEKAKVWFECMRINDAFYHRVSHLKYKVAGLISQPSVFLTFTFRDDVLENTKANTRRQRVIRLLKSFGVPYIANIDFGKKNHREHYHALLQVPKIDCKAVIKQYGYGAIKCEKVRSVDDFTQISKYISKLTNHAIKETTKRSAIIYSR